MPASDKYSPEQKANAVLWYAVCGDPKTVQNKFQLVYDRIDHRTEPPSSDQIQEWYKNFRHLGFVDVQDAVVHEEATGEPIPHIEHHSKIENAMSKVIHKLNNWLLDGPTVRSFHPYHMELIKSDVSDWDERKDFAKTQLEHIHKFSPILKSMWFTGEAKFYLTGRVECINLIYTDEKKPDETEDLPHKVVKTYTPSDAPHVTLWAALNTDLIIGPYYTDKPLSSDVYKDFLKKFVHDLHKVITPREHPVFVQDDCRLHNGEDIDQFLEKEFPNHWIGCGSKYAQWPRHSSDLNPINFFLWGYIKSRVYKTEIKDLDELKQRINAALKSVTPDLLEEAAEDYKVRLERVVKNNGHLVDATVYGEEIDYEALKVWGTYAWPYM